MNRKRVAVLISGRGSNMQALVKAAADRNYPAEIALVLSNRPDAAGLNFARELNIPTEAVDHKLFLSRDKFDENIHAALLNHRIELVACAGFMRLMTPVLIAPWHGRMLNIHPSLLPAYKGLHTHERALADGVKIHGASVHFVSDEMDGGPIIAQAAVPVLPDDTADVLRDRVLAIEHPLYVKALALVASGKVQMSASG